MEIFEYPKRDSDLVSDAESRGIRILTRFPGHHIPEIFIKVSNCVGISKFKIVEFAVFQQSDLISC